MKIEFNPGHRHALEEIGILNPGEGHITAEELATRTLAAVENIEPTIFAVDQQITHVTQAFLLLDSRFERVNQKRLAITDQTSVAEVRGLLVEIGREIASIRSNAEAIRAYVTALNSGARMAGVTMTTRSKIHLDQIMSKFERLLPDLHARESVIQDHLKE